MGGFTGIDEDCIVVASFWNTETSDQTHSASGTPLGTADFQRLEAFLDGGWGFAAKADSLDFWVLPEGWDRPVPAWQLVDGDLDGNERVDLQDFALLARSWRSQCDSCWQGGADLTGDRYLDACDLGQFCAHWLDGKAGPVER